MAWAGVETLVIVRAKETTKADVLADTTRGFQNDHCQGSNTQNKEEAHDAQHHYAKEEGHAIFSLQEVYTHSCYHKQL